MKSLPTAFVPDIRSALKEGIARLHAALIPSAPLAAEILLIHALGRDRTWLYTHPEESLAQNVEELFFALIRRRAAGEPAQYLTGKQEFWGMEFEVTPAVLIPRPETEHLIEVALDRIGPERRNAPLRIADVGTGSGCIAVALAKELPAARIIATDISASALEVASRNAARHAVAQRVQFVEADLFSELFSHSPLATNHLPFDLIVSNPPYVARREAHTLQHEVGKYEPEIALYGGETGVETYTRLIEQVPLMLARGGALVLELGYDSADPVRAMIESFGLWANVTITNDLAGIPRVLAAELKSDRQPDSD